MASNVDTSKLSDQDLVGLLNGDWGRRQRRAEAHRADQRSQPRSGFTRGRPARGPDPAGLLLRHPGPGAQQPWPRRPRSSGAGPRRRLGGEAAAGGSRRAPDGGSHLAELRRGGRHDARRHLCLLGVDEARHGPDGRQGRNGRHSTGAQALLQGAAGPLYRPCAGGNRAG